MNLINCNQSLKLHKKNIETIVSKVKNELEKYKGKKIKEFLYNCLNEDIILNVKRIEKEYKKHILFVDYDIEFTEEGDMYIHVRTKNFSNYGAKNKFNNSFTTGFFIGRTNEDGELTEIF